MIHVRLAECHDTCLEVEGPNGHIANVNPIGFTNPVRWRVDCDTCGTCVREGLETKAEARTVAIAHVGKSSDEFWAEIEKELKAFENYLNGAIDEGS